MQLCTNLKNSAVSTRWGCEYESQLKITGNMNDKYKKIKQTNAIMY